MKRIIAVILCGMFLSMPLVAQACFGPELIIGYDKEDAESYAAAVLLEVYVKEKTGIDAKIRPLTKADAALVDEGKVDILLYPAMNPAAYTKDKLTVDSGYTYHYRTKITEDLRFTTLREALVKLSMLVTAKEMKELSERIKKQGKIRRTIKEFLMENGLW